jgi:hypothetical protein
MPCNSCGGLDHERRSSKLYENQIPTKKQRTDAMFQPLQNQIIGKVLIIVDGIPKRSMFVIKDNLRHSLMHHDNHQTLENNIQNLVSRARDISYMASLLDGVHTLRIMWRFEDDCLNPYQLYSNHYHSYSAIIHFQWYIKFFHVTIHIILSVWMVMWKN